MSGIEKYEVRALTRAELKKLRKQGVDIAAMDENDSEKMDHVIDTVMAMVFGDQVAEIDEEPNPVTLGLFYKITEATYNTPDQLKNSSPPGTGTKKAARKRAKGAGRKRAKGAKKRR